MNDADRLAAKFEQHRTRLRAVAYRMLGSAGEADDAVQEAWIRLSRSDADSIENLGGWLTTVLSRVCLNMLQARRSRAEGPFGEDVPEPDGPAPGAGPADEAQPEREALLADSVALALLIVLDTLTPAERVAFVLHDMFGVPFEEIAPIVARSATATRQLASRARRRVRDAGAGPAPEVNRRRHAEVVGAFLAAAREGDFESLLALLDPDIVLHADDAAVQMGAPAQARGAAAVGGFLRIARGARPALLDGSAAAVWTPGGELRVVYAFTVGGGEKITAIELIADAARLGELDLVISA